MVKKIILFLVVVTMLGACKKKSEDDTESIEAIEDSTANIAESAVSEVNSQANAIITARESYFEPRQSSDLKSIQQLAVCDISTARSACASTVTTVNWGGCTIGSSAVTLSGTITETFAGFGAGVCQLNGDGSNVSRFIDSSNPRTITFTSGAKIVSDMEPDVAWDGTTFSSASTGTVITRSESGSVGGFTCSAGNACYSIVVNGIQNVMTGPKGRTWFDHIIQSSIYSQGKKSTNNLVVSGTVSIWHQLLEYKAENTFTAVTWGDSSCCYPTSGSMSTALTGGITGSLTTTFSSTCGQASFTNEEGDTTTITLKNCSL